MKAQHNNYKKNFFRVITPISLLTPINVLNKITTQKIIFPFYHVVSDQYLPHIAHLYTPLTVSRFTHDLDFLLKHFEPISVQDVYQHTINNTIPRKPSFLLSFDDGLSEVYTVIYPILQKKGIPAVVFVNTSFIDNKDLFYRFKISLIYESILQQLALNRLIFALLKDNNISGENVFSSLMNISYEQRIVLNKILPVCDIDVNQYLQVHQPYLTTTQLLELSKHDFVIGAHGVDHPEFSSLSTEEKLFQLEQSVNEVKEQFSPPLKLFAYPFTDNGLSAEWFYLIEKKKLVDLSFGGAGMYKDIIKSHLQRIPMEKNYVHSAKEVITKEYLYYFSKKIIGKGHVKR